MMNLDLYDYCKLCDWYGNSVQYKRFNYCQAWVSENIYCSAMDIEFNIVKSYNTLVAIIDHTHHKFVRLGKWSRTTSKQSTQIHNTYCRDYEDIQY